MASAGTQFRAANAVSDIYGRARAMIPGQEERDRKAAEAKAREEGLPECCGTLTYRQRLYGWVFCCILGMTFSVICVFMVRHIFSNPSKFAVPYTLGNVSTICGTFFLAGPKKQFKRVMKANRRVCVACYFLSMFLVLVLAFTWKGNVHLKGIVLLVLIICQAFCAVWYVFTYIPGGQRMLKECCKCCGKSAARSAGLPT